MVIKTLFFLASSVSLVGQTYPPQANTAGSTAIEKDSPNFVAWATNCDVQRGPMDIRTPANGNASVGLPSNAIGKANNTIVSLGDGGSAVLTFDKPIMNGAGADFAVFENGFISNANGKAFLELAFVEVSSDGVHYYRFPSVNEYPADYVQNSGAGFATMDARYLHNFAGKYIGGYGTPFNLDELPDAAYLNKNAITHVKLIDVVGANNDPYRTFDSLGNTAIDPFPTGFSSSGFDLDAVGVLHQNNILSTQEFGTAKTSKVWPNPTSGIIFFNENKQEKIQLFNTNGSLIKTGYTKEITWDLNHLPVGVYLLKSENWTEKIIKK